MAEEECWPPRFSLDMDQRDIAIMRLYELMVRLTDDWEPRDARIERVDDDAAAVVLEYDLPDPDAEQSNPA